MADRAARRLRCRAAATVAGSEAFYITHLCGEKRETRAYAILCRLIAEDAGIADWLDDAVTETLPGILISVFDGDTVPLRRAIESAQGDEFARASALAALGYLVRARLAMSDDDMRAYLLRVRREATPRRDSVFWMTWASTAANLGYRTCDFEILSSDPTASFPTATSTARRSLRDLRSQSDAAGLSGFPSITSRRSTTRRRPSCARRSPRPPGTPAPARHRGHGRRPL